MERKVRGYWTIDKVREEALKFNKRSDFQKCSLSAYSIAHKNGWLDDVCSHMNLSNEKWTFDKVKKEALKFNKRRDFKKILVRMLAYD